MIELFVTCFRIDCWSHVHKTILYKLVCSSRFVSRSTVAEASIWFENPGCRGFWFETGGLWRTCGSQELNRQRHMAQVWDNWEYHPGILFLNFTQIFLFLKSHHFRKVFSIYDILIFLYIIRYDNISWRPPTLIPKYGGHEPQTSGLTPMHRSSSLDLSFRLTVGLTMRTSSSSSPPPRARRGTVTVRLRIVTELKVQNFYYFVFCP